MADEKTEANIDELAKQVAQQLAARSQRVVVAWVLGIIIAGGGLVSTGTIERIARPNPFTALDGDKLEERIDALEHWKVVEKIDCEAWRESIRAKIETTEFEIRKDMPPSCWRNMIYTMARYLEKKDLDFTVGEYCR